MVYCMADIHGDSERFNAMLDLIRFSDKDVLYLIGDVIDRGPNGIDILRRVMVSPNMRMTLGNHEELLLDAMELGSAANCMDTWMSNGGESTYTELMYFCSAEERQEILGFIRKLPDHLKIRVNGQGYYLVHACPSDDHHTRIWGRPGSAEYNYTGERIAIVGHTPTHFLRAQQETERKPNTIWSQGKLINIDCGCGHNHDYCRLACLRLEDLAEFYI